MRRQSDWAASPVMFIAFAVAASLAQLLVVAQLFADSVQSVVV